MGGGGVTTEPLSGDRLPRWSFEAVAVGDGAADARLVGNSPRYRGEQGRAQLVVAAARKPNQAGVLVARDQTLPGGGSRGCSRSIRDCVTAHPGFCS